jgi:hypothetical protein
MMTVPDEVWKKSSRSGQDSDCVELSNRGRVRDSKNRTGPAIIVPLAGLLAAAKAGQLDPS